VLGLDREWSAAVVGVGRLGRAIISYPGFAPEGFHILTAFDVDPALIGQTLDRVTVQHMSELEESIRTKGIEIAIVAVPAAQAQQVVDRIVQAGVKAILNYAPVRCQVPPDVKVKDMDPLPALQYLTYHLKRDLYENAK
jgi:redox-sensing transcriptional repressor